jgi:hypothetical protein
MPIHVILALDGRHITLPFQRDNLLEDESDSASTMSVVAIEREVRKVMSLGVYDELVFVPAGETFPLRTAVADHSTISLVVGQGREDHHERDLFLMLEKIAEKEYPPSLLMLKAHFSRVPDKDMPDGWKYIFSP